jgi:DNA polymerase I-like protein with 3'-5' exonuclease and polymerase domains
VVEEKGGIFYGELRQGTARTHRLSSAGRPLKFKQFPKPKSCQFQNYPNQYKRLITARNPGWHVIEADGAQLEFRIAGHLGRDKQIIHDILHKEDIHGYTRDELVRAGEPELLAAAPKDRRRLSKKHTFRPMYGGTSGSDAVQEYCKFFANKYHELHTTQENWALAAAEQGFIETEWGMKYYFPKVYVNKHGYVVGKQQVFNYPVQALATAEVIPIGLVFFWYRTRNAELILTNTIHDSVTAEVPPHELALFQQAAVESFTKDVYCYLEQVYELKMTVPLGVGIKIGTHWGESAYTDEELHELTAPLRQLGYEPVIDDGEVSIDVPN